MTHPAKPRSRAKRDGSILHELPSAPPEANDQDTLEFLQAIDRFKRSTGRSFPTWTEVLGIVRSLGYRKTAPENEAD